MHLFSTLDLMWAYVMFYNISFQTTMLFIVFEFRYKFCIHVIKKMSLFQESPMILFFPKKSFIFSIQLKSIVTSIIFKMAMLMLNMKFIYNSYKLGLW